MGNNSKEAFMDAMKKLLKAKPLKSITVQELTEAAGYSRKSFYKHFADKDDVVQQIYVNEMNCIVNKYGYSDFDIFVQDPLALVGIEGRHDQYKKDMDAVFFENRVFLYKAFQTTGTNSLRSFFENRSKLQYAAYIRLMSKEMGLELGEEADRLAKHHAAGVTNMVAETLREWTLWPPEKGVMFTDEYTNMVYQSIYAYLLYRSRQRFPYVL